MAPKINPWLLSLVCGLSVLLQAQSAHAAPNSVPAQLSFLMGEWESTISDNRYRMFVCWDSRREQMRGTLTRQGITSAYVGFKIGEHIFEAFSISPNQVGARQLYRTGYRGQTTGGHWLNASIDLGASSQNQLVANYPHELGTADAQAQSVYRRVFSQDGRQAHYCKADNANSKPRYDKNI